MKKVKNNKGFTLIELLITIAIMLSLLAVAIVSFIKVSNAKKDESYELVKEQALTAGEQYFETNSYLFEGLTEGSEGVIPLGILVENDYLNKVTDPRTGKALSFCTYVKVVKENGKIKAKEFIDDEDEDCNSSFSISVSEPGAPEVSLNIEGKEGSNDWYKEKDVTLYVKVDDNGNGKITKVEKSENSGKNKPDYVNLENASSLKSHKVTYGNTEWKTVLYKATNEYGKTFSISTSFRVDKEAPNCSSNVISSNTGKTPNSAGWYNIETGAPIITFTATDNLSGFSEPPIITTKTTTVSTVKQGNQEYSNTFKDQAGNSRTCKVTVKYDNKAPTITFAGDYSKIPSNWSNSYKDTDYNVSVTIKDSVSKINTTVKYQNQEGLTNFSNADTIMKSLNDRNVTKASHSVNVSGYKDGARKIKFAACDYAGNCNEKSILAKKDIKEPDCSVSISGVDESKKVNGWYNKATGKPKITFVSSDSLSGIKGTDTYSRNADNDSKQYTKVFTDNAGNPVTCKSSTIKYDGISPTTYQLNESATKAVRNTDCSPTINVFTNVTKKSTNKWSVTKHAEGGLVYSACVDVTPSGGGVASGKDKEYVMWNINNTDSDLKNTSANTGNKYFEINSYKNVKGAFKFTGSSDGKKVYYRKRCTDKAGNKSDTFAIDIITHANGHNCK